MNKIGIQKHNLQLLNGYIPYSQSNIYSKNQNNLVTISFVVKKSGTSDDINNDDVIAILPTGFRPNIIQHGFLSGRMRNFIQGSGHFAIFPSGEIKISTSQSFGIYVLGTANYYI